HARAAQQGADCAQLGRLQDSRRNLNWRLADSGRVPENNDFSAAAANSLTCAPDHLLNKRRRAQSASSAPQQNCDAGDGSTDCTGVKCSTFKTRLMREP